MTLELAILLALLGFVAAFLSGLLGIGGALMLIPMLLGLPSALGLGSFDIKAATAIGVAQVAVASAAGTFANLRRGLIYRRLVVVLVGSLVCGAFVSGWASQFVPGEALLVLLATLSTLGALSMLLPITGQEIGPPKPDFNPAVAALCGLGVGTVIGLVGGGSFMLVPLQVYALAIPTRTAMATGLAAVLPTAVSAVLGKALGGQLPLLPAAMVCLLSIPGAQLGTFVSARLSARVLRRLYAIVILTVSVSMWLTVLKSL